MKVVGLYLSRDYPIKKVDRGTIHINGYHLGNWWQNPSDWGNLANQYSFNRTGLALTIKLPVADRSFKNLDDMIEWLKTNLAPLEMPENVI